MPRVVVIGSANVDFTVRVERLPRMGETVSGGEFYTAFGGKGANQAVAALRAGAEVRFVAKTGRDANGDAILGSLSALGLSPQWILRHKALHSGVALVVVDAQGRNQIAVAPGSNRGLTEADIQAAEPAIAWGQVLLIQLEVPLTTVREALGLAKRHGLTTILNPAPAQLLSPEILALVDYLTPNEAEAGTLTGRGVSSPSEAAEAAEALRVGGVGRVIVTLGDQGAILVQDRGVEPFPPFRVMAVDSTAAGDAFNGSLACALAEGRPLKEAVPFANAAGALAVTRRGAQSSIPTREEIEGLLRRASPATQVAG